MKWFKKKKSKTVDAKPRSINGLPHFEPRPIPGIDLISRLSPPLLERIFGFVCPHAHDESYENCEVSIVGDCCPLCDLRDLSHCAQVCRRWRILAGNVLYHSIRIDAVHYCPLEDSLAEMRKRKSRINRNAEPEDTARARLKLLSRTLRDDSDGVALKVEYFKLPYMTKETCKPDLARSVAVLPNLKYVDLPEGIFTDDPSCNTLKQEIQARCPDLRKMTFMGGSEKSFEWLGTYPIWRNLEVLELSRLHMDPNLMRQALGALPQLRALKIKDMKYLDDQLFAHNDYLPPFPALNEVLLEDTPRITAEGLVAFLFRSETQDALKTLSLTNTGVFASALHQVIAATPNLTFLSIVESVSVSLPLGIPPLHSYSLDTFHYEITSASSANSFSNVTASYYNYLRSSLISNGLPALRQLYVRDPDFPESLIDLAPPSAPFVSDSSSYRPNHSHSHSHSHSASPSTLSPHQSFAPPDQKRFSSNNPFAAAASSPSNLPSFAPSSPLQPGLKQELEVFAKGLDEMEWNFTNVLPPSKPGRRGSASAPRPVSSYGLNANLNMSSTWGQRSSVLVGNGFGGFLKVPAESVGRPSSSAGEKKRGSQYDMWR